MCALIGPLGCVTLSLFCSVVILFCASFCVSFVFWFVFFAFHLVFILRSIWCSHLHSIPCGPPFYVPYRVVPFCVSSGVPYCVSYRACLILRSMRCSTRWNEKWNNKERNMEHQIDQIQPSGIKLDGHQSSVLCCLDEHLKCTNVYLRKQLKIMTKWRLCWWRDTISPKTAIVVNLGHPNRELMKVRTSLLCDWTHTCYGG